MFRNLPYRIVTDKAKNHIMNVVQRAFNKSFGLLAVSRNDVVDRAVYATWLGLA